jgi:hypothetical protein
MVTSTLILLPFLTVAQHESGTRKTRAIMVVIIWYSWIYNYLCNQCLSPLMLWVRIQLRQVVLYTTLCDVCQWLVTGRWFSLYNIMWCLSVTCDRSVVFSIQHYVMFVSDLRQVGGFLLVPPPINLTTTI